MRTFFTNSRGETAVVRLQTGARGERALAQALDELAVPVAHLKLQARFDGFERWIILDSNLDWFDVLVEFDEGDSGFLCCETGRTATIAGIALKPEDLVQAAILAAWGGWSEGEMRTIDRRWLDANTAWSRKAR